MDKMLEFTISGSYKTAQKDIIDFENVKGIVPMQDEDIASMHMQRRFAARWIKEAKGVDGKPLYPERIQRVREIHVDDVKQTTGKLSFVGKNIKELSFEELQDLALAKDLREVPLYKVSDLRNTRLMAYVNYVEKVQKGGRLKYQDEGFNFSKLPPIILTADIRREDEGKVTNDDIIDAEMKSTAEPKTTLTRKDMESIAEQRKIAFHPNISDAKLYERLYGAAA